MGMDDSEAIVEEQFPVGESPELSLGTVSGRVSIGPSSEPIIRVRARKYGRRSAVENTYVEFSRESDLVTVSTKSKSRGVFGSSSVCSVDFDVVVPHGCRLAVDAVSAEVEIRGVGGAVDAHTVSGGISVENASDPISLVTVSGNVTARALRGMLRLSGVSGNMHITDSQLRGFEVESVSGGVQLEAGLSSTGRYRASTVSGGLTLGLPNGTAATIHMASVSGRMHSDLPARIEQLGFGKWQATINGGGTELHLHSVSGNVMVTPAGAPVPV